MRASGSVDIVIATHRTDRPVERAIASVLQDGLPDARVVLVCHGLAADQVAPRVPSELLNRVRVLEHHDGIASAAGPFNAGLDASDAEFVGVLGSDDFLEPGALAAWQAALRDTDAGIVLARLVHQGGGFVRAPAGRWGRRTRRLDPVKDRVFYRTAPLGLMRAAVLDRLGLRFETGLATGEDMAFTVRLYTSGTRIDFAAKAPAYVVGSDAVVRVTHTPRTVEADLEPCLRVVDSAWFADLNLSVRAACVTKFLRIHLFGAVNNRAQVPWPAQQRLALAQCAEHLVAAAPRSVRPFSSAERALWRAVLDPEVPTATLLALSTQKARYKRLSGLVPADPAGLLDPEAAVRRLVASALMR